MLADAGFALVVLVQSRAVLLSVIEALDESFVTSRARIAVGRDLPSTLLARDVLEQGFH